MRTLPRRSLPPDYLVPSERVVVIVQLRGHGDMFCFLLRDALTQTLVEHD